MDMDCIFCDVANKRARANIVLETDEFVVFDNINPQSPVHVLVVPKKHISKKDAIEGKEPGFWDKMFAVVNQAVKALNLNETGYRLVNNGAGYHAVDHEHFHIMGGKDWFPKDNL